jgi:hydrogenase expression/formation protein HypE
VILLAHGGGGMLSKSLIEEVVLRHLDNPILARLDDSACISAPGSELVFTTDSYVVQPVFFPGGDIGRLAACGTINDLAMQGGDPRYLSLAMILEEGFSLRSLERILRSVADVARETGVLVVTGDTKVVERGGANDIFITTSGIGVRQPGVDVHVSNARPGDAVIVTGTVGDHGIAVLSTREGLAFEAQIVSDVAPLGKMTGRLLDVVPSVHCLRDPTRGGLAAALCDIAGQSRTGIRIRESAVPVRKEVRGACALLGLDPLNVANEGKAIVVCSADDAERAMAVLRSDPLGRESAVIGSVVSERPGMVTVETTGGGERVLEMPSGEDLPRIC